MNAILITGVSSGIGFELTKKFIKQGYIVYGSIRNENEAEELSTLLGNSFIPLIFDICKEDEVKSAAIKLQSILKGNNLSAIINNAGTAKIGPLLHINTDEFRKHLDVLVTGQLYVIQTFFKYLIPKNPIKKSGIIITISSISGVNGSSFVGGYVAGKHALEGMSKVLRKELLRYGVKVMVIAPGNIDTPIWDKQNYEIIEKYENTNYFQDLKIMLHRIENEFKKNAMTVEEFSDSFFKIFHSKKQCDRYTIIKKKNLFSGNKVKIIKQ